MAVFKRLSKQQITSMFTDKALLCGVVPVYINLKNLEAPDVAVRNWIPEWAMDATLWLSEPYFWLRRQLNHDYVGNTPFFVTGAIQASGE